MPLSVLNRMEVDYCISISEMGAALAEIINNKDISKSVSIPQDVIAEAAIAERMATGMDVVAKLGKPSVFTCPDCGGILTEIENDKLDRYRCHTGHAYSQDDLVIRVTEGIEATLWVALRMMDERINLLKKLEDQTEERGFTRFAKDHREKRNELLQHIETLKKLLSLSQKDEV